MSFAQISIHRAIAEGVKEPHSELFLKEFINAYTLYLNDADLGEFVEDFKAH